MLQGVLQADLAGFDLLNQRLDPLDRLFKRLFLGHKEAA